MKVGARRDLSRLAQVLPREVSLVSRECVKVVRCESVKGAVSFKVIDLLVLSDVD